MSLRLSVLVPLLIASTVLAADLTEKWSKRLESADAAYQQALQKADNTRFYAVQKATQDRVKLLKTALTDATKAGDFEAATEIKSRLAAAETAGGVRPKPKNTVKFGGHEYALIEEKATWHVAKRRCEEMGGHLATLESPQETAFVLGMCQNLKASAWLGLSNETNVNQWTWVSGEPARLGDLWKLDDPEREQVSAGGVYWYPYQSLTDYNLGHHVDFVCEWET